VTPSGKSFPAIPNIFYFMAEIIDPYGSQYTCLEVIGANVFCIKPELLFFYIKSTLFTIGASDTL
jgi:hypothetical protein